MGKWGSRAGPLSGVDAQRAMLDEMMGMNRNLDNPDAEIEDYRDEVSLISFSFRSSFPPSPLFIHARPGSLLLADACVPHSLPPLSISHPSLPPSLLPSVPSFK